MPIVGEISRTDISRVAARRKSARERRLWTVDSRAFQSAGAALVKLSVLRGVGARVAAGQGEDSLGTGMAIHRKFPEQSFWMALTKLDLDCQKVCCDTAERDGLGGRMYFG